MRQFQTSANNIIKGLFSEEKVFELAFKTYFPRLKSFAIRFVGDQDAAEDIVQNTFMNIWIKREDMDSRSIKSYLFTSVRNACLNHLKRQQMLDARQIIIDADLSCAESLYYADFLDNPMDKTIYEELQKQVDQSIAQLPEQTRRIFSLSRLDGLKNIEIAEQLCVSTRTVEKHNSRALAQLRTSLAI